MIEIDGKMSDSRNSDNPRTLRTCLLHLGTLNAFAVVQPVCDRMISNPQYLRLEGYSGIAITSVVSIFLLAIPIFATASVGILRMLRLPKVATAVFASIGTLLVALLINIAFRWIQWRFALRSAGVPDR